MNPLRLNQASRLAGTALLAGLLAGATLPAWAAETRLSAQLSGTNEVPANTSAATGKLDATLQSDTRLLKWRVTYDKLTGPVSAAHFHGPAAAGQNAPPVVNFTAPLSSPIEGEAVLTPEQVQDLMAGKWYVNLHTAAHPGGEIRGQALPAK